MFSFTLPLAVSAFWLAEAPADDGITREHTHTIERTCTFLPSFGGLVATRSTLVFSSLDGTRLIATDHDGKTLWEKRAASAFRVCGRVSSSVIVQDARAVLVVDIGTGDQRQLLTTASSDEKIHVTANGQLVYGLDIYGRVLRLLDAQSGVALWQRDDVKRVLLATERSLLCVTQRAGYHNPTRPSMMSTVRCRWDVSALDCKTGRTIWAVPIEFTDPHPPCDAERISPYIVVLSHYCELLCIDERTGRVVGSLRTSDVASDFLKRIEAFRGKDGKFVYVPASPDSVMSETRAYTMHMCSLPEFKPAGTVDLKVNGIWRLEFVGDGILIDGGHRIECVDARTGRTRWRKHLMDRSEPVDGKLLASTYAHFGQKRIPADDEIVALIERVDLATGQSRVIHREPVPRDAAESRPSR